MRLIVIRENLLGGSFGSVHSLPRVTSRPQTASRAGFQMNLKRSYDLRHNKFDCSSRVSPIRASTLSFGVRDGQTKEEFTNEAR